MHTTIGTMYLVTIAIIYLLILATIYLVTLATRYSTLDIFIPLVDYLTLVIVLTTLVRAANII